jgi:hypothetical protein
MDVWTNMRVKRQQERRQIHEHMPMWISLHHLLYFCVCVLLNMMNHTRSVAHGLNWSISDVMRRCAHGVRDYAFRSVVHHTYVLRFIAAKSQSHERRMLGGRK